MARAMHSRLETVVVIRLRRRAKRVSAEARARPRWGMPPARMAHRFQATNRAQRSSTAAKAYSKG